jgi:hypothetical protein
MRMASIAASLAQEAGAGRECRDVVGWMVAHRERAALAHKLMQLTCDQQDIRPGPCTIQADRGSHMTAKPVAWSLADREVTTTQSRPQVSHEHPYAEAPFNTLKYRSWRVAPRPCKQLSRHILSDSQASNQHRSSGPRPYGSIGLRKSRQELRLRAWLRYSHF